MAKNNDQRTREEQRRLRVTQVVFALLAIVLILSMLVSLVRF